MTRSLSCTSIPIPVSYQLKCVPFRIEHNKLEFTLTLKIRRDPHIVAQFKALAPPPPPPPPPAPQPVPLPPKPKGGMFSFLSSSPKKPVARATPPPPPAPPHKVPDNLARYLKQDGTLARAFISFKDVAARCDVRLLEIKYPLIGQRSEASGGATTMELGEIALQVFRLPSLPGVMSNQLPLSLDECLRGLRHVAWHKVTYFEGMLTQNGGDCTVSVTTSQVSRRISVAFFYRRGDDECLESSVPISLRSTM